MLYLPFICLGSHVMNVRVILLERGTTAMSARISISALDVINSRSSLGGKLQIGHKFLTLGLNENEI